MKKCALLLGDGGVRRRITLLAPHPEAPELEPAYLTNNELYII